MVAPLTKSWPRLAFQVGFDPHPPMRATGLPSSLASIPGGKPYALAMCVACFLGKARRPPPLSPALADVPLGRVSPLEALIDQVAARETAPAQRWGSRCMGSP